MNDTSAHSRMVTETLVIERGEAGSEPTSVCRREPKELAASARVVLRRRRR